MADKMTGPSHSEMRLALAVDAAVQTEFGGVNPSLSPEVLVGLKFAVMLRMGISSVVSMVAAVEGSERLDYMRTIRLAEHLRFQRKNEDILAYCEQRARLLSKADELRGFVTAYCPGAASTSIED